MVLDSHCLVFFNVWHMLLGQCMDSIESFCRGFDNETSVGSISMIVALSLDVSDIT